VATVEGVLEEPLVIHLEVSVPMGMDTSVPLPLVGDDDAADIDGLI